MVNALTLEDQKIIQSIFTRMTQLSEAKGKSLFLWIIHNYRLKSIVDVEAKIQKDIILCGNATQEQSKGRVYFTTQIGQRLIHHLVLAEEGN